jgi:CubicO group peptidase (beta-lactamase class C family)
MLAEAEAVLERGVADGAFPGAVLAVGGAGLPDVVAARGRLTYGIDSPAVGRATIYDLASLTKVVVTTTTAMMLVDDGVLDLDQAVSAWLPPFRGDGKERVTFSQLLSHSGGLAWWAPLFRELVGQDAFVARISEMPLDYEPGIRCVYSDFGFILLGAALERVAGEDLETLARRRIFAPLGMSDSVYRPPLALRPRIAPTERCAWRGRLIHGEVHDENAFAMGGLASHAGLFSAAPDLARFAHLLLDGGRFGGGQLIRAETIRRFTRAVSVPGTTRALGWDTPSPTGYSTAGSLISRSAFGHVGFTGTSLWVDPDRSLFVILLSNRIHPSRDNEGIRAVRPQVADAVVRALDASRGVS